MAAEVIERAAGDYRRMSLMTYEKRLRARFGGPGLPLEALLPTKLRHRLGRRLLSSPWATRHLILNRAFLRCHPPALKKAPTSAVSGPESAV